MQHFFKDLAEAEAILPVHQEHVHKQDHAVLGTNAVDSLPDLDVQVDVEITSNIIGE